MPASIHVDTAKCRSPCVCEAVSAGAQDGKAGTYYNGSVAADLAPFRVKAYRAPSGRPRGAPRFCRGYRKRDGEGRGLSWEPQCTGPALRVEDRNADHRDDRRMSASRPKTLARSLQERSSRQGQQRPKALTEA
jgi:hypothetical protein